MQHSSASICTTLGLTLTVLSFVLKALAFTIDVAGAEPLCFIVIKGRERDVHKKCGGCDRQERQEKKHFQEMFSSPPSREKSYFFELSRSRPYSSGVMFHQRV